jgi:hypothetical protein
MIMKNLRYFKSIFLLTVLFSATSCNDWLDDNKNPSLTLVNPPNLVLPAIEAELGFRMGSDLLRYGGLWSQQIAAQNGRQTEAYDLFVVVPSDVNNVWRTGFYAGFLKDIEEILAANPESTHPYYFGMCKIMKAFGYSMLVDFWGDVPFSEAMKGNENVQPKADDDASIYPQLITLLESGIADMKKTSGLRAPSTDDYFYRGDAARWIRLANSIKLRMYLHLANIPSFNTSVINKFITDTPENEFMGAVSDDFQLNTDVLSGRQNPVHQFILNRTDDICTSATIINLMNSKSDPRRARYFTPAPFSPALYATPPTGNTGYVGLANGTSNFRLNNDLSRLHTYVRGTVTTTAIPTGPSLAVGGLAYNGQAPVPILTFAEYNFIRAELALRYGAPGSAQSFYTAGINASFADVGLTAAQASSYLATSAGTLTGTQSEKLKQLIEEKYVANFLVTGEPYSDWRRTGFPLLSNVPSNLNPGNGGVIPRVLPYPQQEIDANPNLKPLQDARSANLSAPAVRVFWDVRQ